MSISDSDRETANSVIAFTGKLESESVFSDEDMTDEDLVATYRLVYTKWEKACIIGEK